jgi:hypothetical protein
VYGNSILEAIEGLEKEYANLQPEIMTAQDARALLSAYARCDKLVSLASQHCLQSSTIPQSWRK